MKITYCAVCDHFDCVCGIRRAHAEDCKFRRAAASDVGIACDHGYDVCPVCDPCTCDVAAVAHNGADADPT